MNLEISTKMNFLSIKGDLGDIVGKVDYRGFVQVSVVLSIIVILVTQYFQRAKTIVYHKGKSGWIVIPAYYFVNTLRIPVLRMFGGFITLYNLRKCKFENDICKMDQCHVKCPFGCPI